MGQMAVRTLFDGCFAAVNKITFALFFEEIQRAIAKKAVELRRGWSAVTREILTFPITEKFKAVFHICYSTLSVAS